MDTMMSKMHAGELLTPLVFPRVFSPCLPCHLGELLFLVVQFCVFIPPAPSSQSAVSAQFQRLQDSLGQTFFCPGVYAVWYVLELLLHVDLVHSMHLSQKCQSKFLILQHGRVVLAIPLSMSVICIPHSFPRKMVTMQTSTAALTFLFFFQNNLLLFMLQLACLNYFIHLKTQKITW